MPEATVGDFVIKYIFLSIWFTFIFAEVLTSVTDAVWVTKQA